MPPKAQPYVRDKDGFLDAEKVVGSVTTLSADEINVCIRRAIIRADEKSMRNMLSLSESTDPKVLLKSHRKAARKLFNSFKKYCVDPATADASFAGKSVARVVDELIAGQEKIRARMNAGWRYQFLALEIASKSPNRFREVSGGGKHGDLSLLLDQAGSQEVKLYVSIKNRKNTVSGSKWPGAVTALEKEAVQDPNRPNSCAYLCVFGAAIEHGSRTSLNPSSNTEFWKSDFFWPFLTGLSYAEVMRAVGKVLALQSQETKKLPLPTKVLEEFESLCRKAGLLDVTAKFNESGLLEFFL